MNAGRLRDALASGPLVRAAGAHDGLTARLAEEAGFDAVWASSFEISTAHGLPDVSLLVDRRGSVCDVGSGGL
jgi:phosphoenolpyruvate phosphomutase